MLEEAGFPQELNYRDSVYFPATKEYGNPVQVSDGVEYIRVPHTVAIISDLEDFDYSVECTTLNHRGVTLRGYRLTAPGIKPIEDASLGVVMGLFWIQKKGLGNVDRSE